LSSGREKQVGSNKDLEQDESISKIDNRVDKLETRVSKLDKLDTKMDKMHDDSQKIIQQQQEIVESQKKILASQREQRALQVLQSQTYSPTGFFAHELVSYLIGHLDKYQTTAFRRWLAVKGGKVVELNIAQMVNQKISMIQWYDTHLDSIDETHYHFTSKSAFPFQINSGIPFVGTLTLTRVLMDISGDVNTETRETTNMKCKCSADQENRQIYQDLEDDVVGSLKPHKTAYKILRPFGIAGIKLYHLLVHHLSFSIPLVIILLATIIMPWIPPASILMGALGLAPGYWVFLGINPTYVLWGLINGIIYGAIIFVGLRYHVVRQMRTFSSKLHHHHHDVKPESETKEVMECKIVENKEKKE
jgi:hypothetical protein